MAQRYKPTIDAPVVRIMVLETDKPHPDTQTEKGSFGEILHRHFSRAGEAHHPPLGIETDQEFVVTEQGGRMPSYDEFEGFDGLLITGSMFDAHGDNDWILQLLELLQGQSCRPSQIIVSSDSPRTLDQEARLQVHGRLLRPPAPRPPPRRSRRPFPPRRLGTRPLPHHAHAHRPAPLPHVLGRRLPAPDAPGSGRQDPLGRRG